MSRRFVVHEDGINAVTGEDLPLREDDKGGGRVIKRSMIVSKCLSKEALASNPRDALIKASLRMIATLESSDEQLTSLNLPELKRSFGVLAVSLDCLDDKDLPELSRLLFNKGFLLRI